MSVAVLIGLLTPACAAVQTADLPRSDHCDGHRFFNPDGDQGTGGEQKRSMLHEVHDLIWPHDHSWPARVPVTPTRPPARVAGGAMRVTWIGQ